MASLKFKKVLNELEKVTEICCSVKKNIGWWKTNTKNHRQWDENGPGEVM